MPVDILALPFVAEDTVPSVELEFAGNCNCLLHGNLQKRKDAGAPPLAPASTIPRPPQPGMSQISLERSDFGSLFIVGIFQRIQKKFPGGFAPCGEFKTEMTVKREKKN
jgi:hypothetical protein